MKNKLFVFGLALVLSVSFVNIVLATDTAGAAVGGSVVSGTTMTPPTPPVIDTTNFTDAQKTALASVKTLMDQSKALREQADKVLKDAGITPKMMGQVEMKDKMKGDKGTDQEDNQGDHQDGEKVFDMKKAPKLDGQKMDGNKNPENTKKTGDIKKPSSKKAPKKMGDKKEGDKKGGEGKGPFMGDRKSQDGKLPPANNTPAAPAQNAAAPAVNQ
ncbi:MAG: hypothetical protein NTX85_01135 [Candidatus Nomurabacteria bacterium]|nr:hypothetical protein [Candidatus Nomurabacteria bacterium]